MQARRIGIRLSGSQREKIEWIKKGTPSKLHWGGKVEHLKEKLF